MHSLDLEVSEEVQLLAVIEADHDMFKGFTVLLFTPYIADILGRRVGTAIGCGLVIIGSVIQALPQAGNPDVTFSPARSSWG